MYISRIWKLIASLISTVGVTATVAILWGLASPSLIVVAVIRGLTSLSVYQFANKPYGWQRYVKTIVEALGAISVPVLVAVVTRTLTPELAVIGLTGLVGAFSVYGTPNVDPALEASEIEAANLPATDGTEFPTEEANV